MWTNTTGRAREDSRRGFTIVELLIVIVVIGILAAITIVAYNGVQARAHQAKIQHDEQAILTAIIAAQTLTGGTLKDVVTDFWIGQDCSSVAPGTDLSTLPKTTHGCWTRYLTALDKISIASQMNIRNIVDPWGRPYWIDSNEGESTTTPCVRDDIATYAIPTNASNTTNRIYVPLTLAGC